MKIFILNQMDILLITNINIMAKSKYCYVIANEKNGNMLFEDGKLPIFWNRECAKLVCLSHVGFVVHKLFLSDIESIVLNSKKA